MVACAALSSSLQNHAVVPMTAQTCAQTVEEIKKRLTEAAENDDQSLCESLLNEVRPMVTTREILEETRIGFIVNNLRRQYFKKWPTLLRISREVIKSWSDIVSDDQKRPQSGASSRNTTPNVLSPSVAKLMQRGITPNTPAGRRVTSTGLQGSQSRLVSPANGSYAPRSQVSPGVPNHTAATNGMHKSATVSGDLLKHAAIAVTPTTPKENGKRKAIDDTTTTAPSIKRTKTATGALSVSVAPGTPTTPAPATPTTTSVLAARKAVQSTSELFAQMSQTLPQHIDIGTDIREHEEKVKSQLKDEELAHQLQTSASYGSFATTTATATVERKKRKYERKIQKATASPMLPSSSTQPEERLVIRLPKNGMTTAMSTPTVSSSSKSEEKLRKFEPRSSVARPTTPPPTIKEVPIEEEEDEEEEEVKPKPEVSKLKDWKSLIPSMEELKIRAQLAEEETRKVVDLATDETKRDPTRVQLLKNFRRPILILPYLENPTGPDFLLHKYPNRLQYYSEDNFRYGEKRPTE